MSDYIAQKFYGMKIEPFDGVMPPIYGAKSHSFSVEVAPGVMEKVTTVELPKGFKLSGAPPWCAKCGKHIENYTTHRSPEINATKLAVECHGSQEIIGMYTDIALVNAIDSLSLDLTEYVAFVE